ncbi:MAG: SUMF1/EgtB/PvdO family nonheme iron enzyme [Wenzhouxiangella sp.]|nr:SUMF1/EgtB/PvdO family nonheme iron enzyme [Wenzhouxiangella sp.]
MPRDLTHRLRRLLLLSVCLPLSTVMADSTLPLTSTQTQGLGYEPFFLSAILEPAFDEGTNPGTWPDYGYSVALDGDWLLVGVPYFRNSNQDLTGAVFLYQRQGADWVQRRRIQFAAGGNALCGSSVALNRNIAVIGCPFHTSDGLTARGRALIYRLDPTLGVLTLERTVLGEAAEEQCGYAVATDGTGLANSPYAAIGCPGRGSVGGGGSRGGVSLYRYTLNPGNQTLEWLSWGNLSPDDEGDPQSANWRFGAALSLQRIEGDSPVMRLLVGMPAGRPDGILAAGLAYLYERPVSSGSWAQVRRFSRPGGSQSGAEFGRAVSLAGARVAIGAPGAGHDATAARAGMVYSYLRIQLSGGATSWQPLASVGAEMAQLNPSGNGRFGHAVALSGTDLWISQPFRVDQEHRASVWRYRFSGTGTDRLLTDIHQLSLLRQGVTGEELGYALGVDRNSSRIAVGAPSSLLSENNATGLVVVYERSERLFADRFGTGRLLPGAQLRDCQDCPQMVMIPAGSYAQGSPPGAALSFPHERPQRQVNIPAFAIGMTEVTFAQWDACVADGGCTHSPSDAGQGRGSRPVVGVSRDDVAEYLAWLGAKTGRVYRLPSESEWEYAARAGTTSLFNTGNCIATDQANFRGPNPAPSCPEGVNRERALPVASFAPNAFGLYDTHGNVSEWVQDCWNDNYAGAPTNGSAWMTGDCSLAVWRSGNYVNFGGVVRSAYRGSHPRDSRFLNHGFRVARSTSP